MFSDYLWRKSASFYKCPYEVIAKVFWDLRWAIKPTQSYLGAQRFGVRVARDRFGFGRASCATYRSLNAQALPAYPERASPFVNT